MPTARRAGTVVVVDDDSGVRTLYEVALSLRGHRVEGAETVTRGLEACERLLPDVAIIDIFIPERSGLDLIRMLRERGGRTRIIAVTAADRGRTSTCSWRPKTRAQMSR